MEFKKVSGLFMCYLTKFKQAASSGTEASSNHPPMNTMSIQFRLIEDTCTFTAYSVRGVCNSLNVMCGLAIT